eukprot:2879517-Lingulodinium_polyedra.AAC.1
MVIFDPAAPSFGWRDNNLRRQHVDELVTTFPAAQFRHHPCVQCTMCTQFARHWRLVAGARAPDIH